MWLPVQFQELTLIWPGLRLRVSISLSWEIFLGLKVLFCLFGFNSFTLKWLPAPLGSTVSISNWQVWDSRLKPCLRLVPSFIQMRSRGRSLFFNPRQIIGRGRSTPLPLKMLFLSPPSKSVNESKIHSHGPIVSQPRPVQRSLLKQSFPYGSTASASSWCLLHASRSSRNKRATF